MKFWGYLLFGIVIIIAFGKQLLFVIAHLINTGEYYGGADIMSIVFIILGIISIKKAFQFRKEKKSKSA